jgi:hypothetical protein
VVTLLVIVLIVLAFGIGLAWGKNSGNAKLRAVEATIMMLEAEAAAGIKTEVSVILTRIKNRLKAI